MDFLSPLLAIASGFLGLVFLYNLWKLKVSRKNDGMFAPEPPGAWPIVGHLHQLLGKNPIARTLGAMADKHGHVFLIRLGAHPVLVISNHEAVKECFTKNDRILASRPRSSHGEFLGYNYAAFGFASYGKFWREIRKIVLLELLSGRRLETLKHVQVSEVGTFITDLYSLCKSNGHAPVKVVISQRLQHMTLNIIFRMIAGKRYFGSGGAGNDYGEAQRIGDIIKEFMYVSGVPVVSDLIPVLGWVDFQRILSTMKRVAKEFDCLVGSWLEEHKMNGVKSEANKKQDFMDVMLSVIREDPMFGHSRDNIIKGTAMTLIIAGSDTTSITLIWILSILLNNRNALKRAQEELDLKVGKNRLVEDSDIQNLTYLQAIVKETLRLYPPGPLAVPHEASEDCHVSGYRIPKGTRLFVNLWKLHRDPQIWSNPDEFVPERFLTEHVDVDVSGQHFEMIPFGSGRRSCPGMILALQVTHLTLARLLQGFEFATEFDAPVDMTEGLGITLPKVTPLEVMISPRLSSQLYEHLI